LCLLPLGVLLLLLLLLLPLGVLLLLLLCLLPLGVLLLLLLCLLPLGVLLLLLLLLLPLGVLLLLLLCLLPLGVLLLLLLLLLPLGVLLLLLLLLLYVLRLGYGGSSNIWLLSTLWCSPHRRLNTLYPTHIHDTNRCTRSRCTLAHLPDFGWWKRAARGFSQRWLQPLERDRSRRRRGSRHHAPARHVGRGTRSPGGGVRPWAQNTRPLGRNGRSRDNPDRT
jgi:hypothetical protein